jgi:hypothetical protein
LQGLITGRTSYLLLDPDNADLAAKKNVASTQSHEVAHMWLVSIPNCLMFSHGFCITDRFGNLTTMEWWDYLYLNEGQSTWSLDDPRYSCYFSLRVIWLPKAGGLAQLLNMPLDIIFEVHRELQNRR